MSPTINNVLVSSVVPIPEKNSWHNSEIMFHCFILLSCDSSINI